VKYLKEYNTFSIRDEYKKSSPEQYYLNNSNEYSNPHKDRVIKSLDYLISKIDIGYFLDLSCGDGIISEYLHKAGYDNFIGCDPYFSNIYQSKFNKVCLNKSFKDISLNGISDKFKTIICSYALHLCDKTYLNNLLYQLSLSCENFIVISPSKYPIINESYFKLVDYKILNRTHIRTYKSIL